MFLRLKMGRRLEPEQVSGIVHLISSSVPELPLGNVTVVDQNGNLLNAVQYLINRLFADAVGKKIYCECENYRKKKEVELSAQAHRYARQVRRSGKAVALPELNPFERRIIHMTINKYSDLESKSDGDSFLKVITIRKKANG